MEAEGCGRVEVDIGVVDRVKAPQQRPPMIRTMPEICHDVQNDNRRGHLCPIRQRDRLEDADSMLPNSDDPGTDTRTAQERE